MQKRLQCTGRSHDAERTVYRSGDCFTLCRNHSNLLSRLRSDPIRTSGIRRRCRQYIHSGILSSRHSQSRLQSGNLCQRPDSLCQKIYFIFQRGRLPPERAGAHSIHPRTGCHQAAQNCRYYQNLSRCNHSASGWKCHRCRIDLSQNRVAFNPKNRTVKGQIHLNDAFKRTQR